MTIRSIGLNTPVFQGWLPDIMTEASKALNRGPAFYPPNMKWGNGLVNSLPGQGGTVAMLGHRTTRTHPFCLVGSLETGDLAVVKMRYGTFLYRLIAKPSRRGTDWSAFEHPARFDPHPRRWNKGIRPEYLVGGACDPPHYAGYRLNPIFKLVGIRAP
ncbi:sortase [Candidatus Saccharibacteria bacterium]|nr:sortase [Candidatus Saccharibacteria bacterium]